ncbi:MAG: nitroreductase family deazaflavin-dependent oxidoreductase [Acidimicrobiales bacterium]
MTHQRCRVHFAWNLLASVPKENQEMAVATFRTVFANAARDESAPQYDHGREMFVGWFELDGWRDGRRVWWMLATIVQDVGMAKSYRLGSVRRAVNVTMAALIRRGLGGKSSYLLTTTGRRTGEKRTTPVIVIEVDGQRWLVSPYGTVGWVHNVRASHQVTLQRGKRTETTYVEEVGAEEAGPVLQRYVQSVRVTAPKADDSVQRFVDEASRHPAFKIGGSSPQH